MPIENERKYVLPPDFDATRLQGWTRLDMRQAYLDDGPRIRQIGDDYVFTYKKWAPHAQELVEIETAMTRDDFDLLWPLRVDAVRKTRYVKSVGDSEWVVDFLRDDDGKVYFVLAEVELPRFQPAPAAIVDEISADVIHVVAADDARFSNRMLADRDHARRLLAEVSPRLEPQP